MVSVYVFVSDENFSCATNKNKDMDIALRLILMVSVFVSDEKFSCATNKNEDMDIAFKSYLAKFVFEAQHVQPFSISFTMTQSVKQSHL